MPDLKAPISLKELLAELDEESAAIAEYDKAIAMTKELLKQFEALNIGE